MEYNEPASHDELVFRRAMLTVEMNQLHDQLRASTRTRDTNAINARLTEIISEFQLLKLSAARLYQEKEAERKKWGVVENGLDRFRVFKKVTSELCDYVLFLERDNAELRAENDRLKAEIGASDKVSF